MSTTFTSMFLPVPGRALRPRASDAEGIAPSSETDALAVRLSAAVGRGDEAAFRELYDQYHDRLLRFATVLARGDAPLAQDVVQATLLTAAARLRRVESEAHLWNWLARVARQHSGKIWRSTMAVPPWVGLEEADAATAAGAADRLLEDCLDAALSELEAVNRKLVEWFYFDRLSHAEIAERMGMTSKAVSARLERARATLQKLVARKLRHEC